MRFRRHILTSLGVMILGVVSYAAGQEQAKGPESSSTPAATSDSAPASASSRPKLTHEATNARFEGEKRFRANCGRCHMAPHKFPPRMMATIERHMRVRAMITDEDMRFILAYMTE